MIETITSYDTGYDSGASAAISIGSTIGGIVVYLITAWFLSRVFSKAGIPAWMGWVPFVNIFHLYKLGGFSGWWILINLVPFLGNLVAVILLWIAEYRISKGFEKPGVFVLVAIFFHIIWLGILAFDRSRWIGTPESSYPARA
jgi:hypothetical protein